MTRHELLQWISIDRNVCCDKPCIKAIGSEFHLSWICWPVAGALKNCWPTTLGLKKPTFGPALPTERKCR